MDVACKMCSWYGAVGGQTFKVKRWQKAPNWKCSRGIPGLL